MQNYIWIILIIFVIAIVGYLKKTKGSEDENTGEERYLIGVGGIYDGQVFSIGKGIVIGRDSERCGIIYPGGTKGVSAVHCKVMVEDDRTGLVDLASTYGTFRDNGEKLSPNVVYYLRPGDGFYIGNADNTFLLK